MVWGAVLSHVFDDGEEKPIAYASLSLSASEQNYSMIEKEALAIMFGIKKFHQYLFGRRFSLLTDHRPLTLLLGPKRGIPVLAASRLQRWAIQLSAYQYDIEYRASKDHANAGALSRLPRKTVEEPDVWSIEADQVNRNELKSLCRKSARPHVGIQSSLVRCIIFCMVGQQKNAFQTS